MAFSFIHTGDLHLDSPLAGLSAHGDARAEAIATAPRRAFQALVDTALDRGVDAVLIAGDLWDGSWSDVSAGLFVQRQAARLREAGIATIAILGNHDAQSRVTDRIRAIDAMTVLCAERPQTVTVGPAKIHGMSFATPAVTENLALKYPDAVPGAFNIGLLHTMLEGAEGHAPYAPAKLTDLAAKGYDYFALGHVHARAILMAEPAGRGGTVAYCGVLQGRDVGEPGPKGAYHVRLAMGEPADVTPIDFDYVLWATLKIPVADDGSFRTALDGALREAAEARAAIVAVRIVLEGASAAHDRMIAQRADIVEKVLLAAEGASDRLMVEKVVIDTRPRDPAPVALPAGFEGFLERAAADPALGAALGDVFDIVNAVPSGPARERLRARLAGYTALEDMRDATALAAPAVRRLAARLAERQS